MKRPAPNGIFGGRNPKMSKEVCGRGEESSPHHLAAKNRSWLPPWSGNVVELDAPSQASNHEAAFPPLHTAIDRREQRIPSALLYLSCESAD
ncbi:hypothetical protein B0A55_11884 [Friedmanniomyces simplex]|uniref:Uncharacterized protein n=1 Tax=Friedmanniomyces simplex TaxID=329884 RepID=A0A4U0WNM6_9PEZI|nr:hypothetical protein B0A55_11884 [Friedmanniomyces simplex]